MPNDFPADDMVRVGYVRVRGVLQRFGGGWENERCKVPVGLGLMYPRPRPEEEQVAPMMSCPGRDSMSATWK